MRPVQLALAVLGALFMPLLALTRLILNNNRAWVGPRLRNGRASNLLLVLTLLVFLVVGALDLSRRVAGGG